MVKGRQSQYWPYKKIRDRGATLEVGGGGRGRGRGGLTSDSKLGVGLKTLFLSNFISFKNVRGLKLSSPSPLHDP